MFDSPQYPFCPAIPVPTTDGTLSAMKGRLEETAPKRYRPRKALVEYLPREKTKTIIKSNVALIKTLPAKMHERLEKYILSVFDGKRNREDLITYIQKYGGVTFERAQLIADDQITKAVEQFKVEKMKQQGVEKVKWVHGNSDEPRRYHKDDWDGKSGKRGKPNALNGFEFKIDNPPVINKKTGERGYPGQLVNCRCHLEKA